MIKRGLRWWAVLVVVPLVLGACSSGGGDNGDGGDNGGDGGGTSQSVSAEDFASTVCTGLKTWLSDIQKGATDLATGISSGSSPQQGKDVLTNYLDAVIDATETFVATIRSAGVPDVTGGSDAANALADAFERIETALQQAKESVQDLPTDSPQAFAAAAANLARSIQTNLASATDALRDVPAPDLEQAFANTASCTGAAPSPGS